MACCQMCGQSLQWKPNYRFANKKTGEIVDVMVMSTEWDGETYESKEDLENDKQSSRFSFGGNECGWDYNKKEWDIEDLD